MPRPASTATNRKITPQTSSDCRPSTEARASRRLGRAGLRRRGRLRAVAGDTEGTTGTPHPWTTAAKPVHQKAKLPPTNGKSPSDLHDDGDNHRPSLGSLADKLAEGRSGP